MKATMIYDFSSKEIEDCSKDSFRLEMDMNELRQLREVLEWAMWESKDETRRKLASKFWEDTWRYTTTNKEGQ